MSDKEDISSQEVHAISVQEKKLTPEALRALAEAEARRAHYDAQAKAAKPVAEINGREGPEAIRYGDWESKGIATDF